MSSFPSFSALISALEQGEGANVPGSIPNVTGNVGDLEIGDVGYGITYAANNQPITSFGGDSALGTSELENVVNTEQYNEQQGLSPSMTLTQFLNQYSTGNQNTQSSLSTNVPNILGVSGNTPLTSFAQTTANGTTANPSATSQPSWLQWFENNVDQPLTKSVFGSPTLPSIPSLENIVFILVGLVLIAGAVFGFRQLSTTVVQGVKAGAIAGA